MTALAKFDPVAATIAEVKAKNASLVFDYEDMQGNKDARSHIFKLRQTKTAIAEIHKEVKAEALAFGKACDKKKRDLTAELDEMIDFHAKPIKEIEQRETKRMADEAEALRLEKERKEAEKVAELEAREAAIVAKEQEAKEEEERKAKEYAAKVAEENEKLRAEKAKIEEEKRKLEAEAEASRREKQAREDAINQAEAEKILAAEKAEYEKQEAIEAEQERFREQQEAERAEKARLADIEAKRIADKKHRAKIEDETHQYIGTIISNNVDAELNEVLTNIILDALRKNEIPNVKIIY